MVVHVVVWMMVWIDPQMEVLIEDWIEVRIPQRVVWMVVHKATVPSVVQDMVRLGFDFVLPTTFFQF
jgi:hypothetical protein